MKTHFYFYQSLRPVLLFSSIQIGILFASPVTGQTFTYYSEQFKATIILDLNKMNSENAKAYGLLVGDASESFTPHSLNGLSDDKLTKEKSLGSFKKIGDNVSTKIEYDNTKELIQMAKKKVSKLMEQSREKFVANARDERTQRLRNIQNSPNSNSSHNINSKALEQLKSINSAGAWKNN